ncbi:uncharacterized protein ARB_04027 [Trichophyton benhamiae CBS 112371]|uniref:Uncharacterized protein n=1 Tax=Arthroderma benhamiae (strain ATCC MYA-4681 / CBS 112371) TaxID=663331 RepID=D4AID3_ARTBC|nr:uncharacterized protein ARB_04027 [Trichophyton benhamiae CBS 112371]EFE36506.1 hypothetical protein ARB_04027 [Trichophyton benhamiae CBS 112371]
MEEYLRERRRMVIRKEEERKRKKKRNDGPFIDKFPVKDETDSEDIRRNPQALTAGDSDSAASFFAGSERDSERGLVSRHLLVETTDDSSTTITILIFFFIIITIIVFFIIVLSSSSSSSSLQCRPLQRLQRPR